MRRIRKGNDMDSDSRARNAAVELLPYVSPVMTEKDLEGYKSPMSAGEPQLALMWLLGYAGLPEVSVPREIILNAIATLPDDDKDDYTYLIN